MLRLLAAIILTTVVSTPVMMAGTSVRQFAEAVVADLGIEPRSCHFLPDRVRETTTNVCGRVPDEIRHFKTRMRRVAAASGAHWVSDWISLDSRLFRDGTTSKVTLRTYELDGVSFPVIFDKQDRWLLIPVPDPPARACKRAGPRSAGGPIDLTRRSAARRNIDLPATVTQVSPRYPWIASELFPDIQDAQVFVNATVSDDGDVTDACVSVAVPRGLGFEEAAVTAVRAWHFDPALRNGVPLAVRRKVQVRFQAYRPDRPLTTETNTVIPIDTNVRRFTEAMVTDLDLEPMPCEFLPDDIRHSTASVCAHNVGRVQRFTRRWERKAAARGAQPLSDWVLRNSTLFRNDSPGLVSYRSYQLGDTSFVVVVDKQGKWLLVKQTARFNKCGTNQSESRRVQDLQDSDETRSPRLVEKIKPAYPWLADELRVQGRVFLKTIVTEDGKVEDACILATTAAGLGLEAAAIAAIEQWRYEPAVRDGEPVSVYFTVTVDFEPR